MIDPNSKPVLHILNGIFGDICDRKGIGDELYSCDKKIRHEIYEGWRNIIVEGLEMSTYPEEFKALEEENTKLRNLLSQWGRHLEGCGWVSPLVNGEYKKRWVGGCTCGYNKATEQALK